MSTLHVILFFAGIPLLAIVVISLLVMAPSLARGPRYRPGQPWDAEPEWFGAPGDLPATPDRPALPDHDLSAGEARQLEATAARDVSPTDEFETGGASAHW